MHIIISEKTCLCKKASKSENIFLAKQSKTLGDTRFPLITSNFVQLLIKLNLLVSHVASLCSPATNTFISLPIS